MICAHSWQIGFFVTLHITNSLKWRTTYQTTVCLGYKLQHSNIESHHWCLFKAVSVCAASNQISICTSGSRKTSTSNIQEGKIGWSRGPYNHTTRAEPPIWKCSIQNGIMLYLTMMWSTAAPPWRCPAVHRLVVPRTIAACPGNRCEEQRDPENFILLTSVHKFHYIKYTPTNALIYD